MSAIFGLGLIFILGLLSTRLTERVKAPAITAYILLGLVMGPSLLKLIPADILESSGFISNIALSLIAFNIGQNFSRHTFRQIGVQVVVISVFEALGAFLLVIVALVMFLNIPFHVALVFGAIAAASAPAALLMVVRETKAKGRFTDMLMGVVAIDDAWGLIIFSFSLAVARAMHLHLATSLTNVFIHSFLEIAGSVVLGVAIGAMFNVISRLLRNQTELLIFTLGAIFLTAGAALMLNLSVLLSALFLSAFIVNTNHESTKYFDILTTVDWPIYLLFFVLAGANLEIHLLPKLGMLGLTYLVIRVLGKMTGTYLGGLVSKMPSDIRNYLGLGLLPQAGVALGMALIVKDVFYDFGSLIFTTIAATTIIYEIVGPVVVRFALAQTGQIPAHR